MFNKTTSKHAFTLIELLIAVIIISILVAIIVPVYVNRANEARLTAAHSDLDALKKAEEHAAIDTTYFYRLYVLDDTRGGDDVAPDSTNDVTDGIRDERLRSDASNQDLVFVSSKDGNILASGATIFDRMTRNETEFNWNGPYVNYQRKYRAGEGAGRTPVGLPLDPWGNPYVFLTKAGLIKEPEGIIAETITVGGNTHDAKVFDRPTVLSTGPDGVPGSGAGTTYGQGDDLYRQF